MAGFKQCITINSDGGKYEETIKAVAMEAEIIVDEETDSMLIGTKVNGLEQIITFFRKVSKLSYLLFCMTLQMVKNQSNIILIVLKFSLRNALLVAVCYDYCMVHVFY